MVFLINIIPALLVLFFGLVIVYAVPSKAGKVIMGAIGVLMLIVYLQIQPSYMPKGTVKALPNAEFQVSDAPVVDLQLKPKSSELYDAERNAAMERIDQSIKMQIEMNKQIKSNKE